MSRIVSVWLPLFPLERLQRETAKSGNAQPAAERPFALVGSEERGLILTAVNAACHDIGLAPGVALADARAICPHLLTTPAAPQKDADALLALGRWCGRFSPSLNVDGKGGLWLDITGIPHLFGGEKAMLADMGRRFASLGFTVRLAIADTLGGAHALARYGQSFLTIVPDGAIEKTVASLPVEALRLEAGTAHVLRRLGLKRIGQLYDLPRANLERRFHSKEAAETVLLRLDQALGRREEPSPPLLPLPGFSVRLSFTEPLITHDGIVAGIAHLAGTLCDKLARAGCGARSLRLQIYRADGSLATIDAGLSAATREPPHFVRLLNDKIETLDLGFGVDLMRLDALASEPLMPAQTSFAGSDGKAKADLLIDRLVNRLGMRGVGRLFPLQSHIPERAQKTKSVFAGEPSWAEPTPLKPVRPALLLSEPEPVAVLAEIPEGQPVRFTWRRVTRRVVKAEGPERIAPEWWREFLSSEKPRDYYRIEDEDGHRYWLFREGLYRDGGETLPAWYLHGVFG